MWLVRNVLFPDPLNSLSAAGVTACVTAAAPENGTLWQHAAMPHSAQGRDGAVPSPVDVSAGS